VPATQPYHRPLIRPGRGREGTWLFQRRSDNRLGVRRASSLPTSCDGREGRISLGVFQGWQNWRTRSQRQRRWLRGLGRQSRRRSPRSCRKSKTILRHRSCCTSPRHMRTSPSSRREQGPLSRLRAETRWTAVRSFSKSWSLAPVTASWALAEARASATAPRWSGVCCRRDRSNPSPACRSRIWTTRSRRQGKSSRLLLHRRQGSALRRSERVPQSPVPLAYVEVW